MRRFETLNRTILELKPVVTFNIDYVGSAHNRTILELKLSSSLSRQLYLPALNRTILELKLTGIRVFGLE